MPRQLVTSSTWPPITGARIGARPVTSISIEKKRTSATPSWVSRTIARAITIPAAPVAPCTKRSPASAHTVGAAAHSAEASV